jgi:hypothetical protein
MDVKYPSRPVDSGQRNHVVIRHNLSSCNPLLKRRGRGFIPSGALFVCAVATNEKKTEANLA